MIAYFKEAEKNPALLEKELEFLPEAPFAEGETDLQPENSYSVESLIERMIINSDNTAFFILTFNIDYHRLEKVHRDLGIALPQENTAENFVNVKSYSSLFRILFNASYLNKEMSEKALEVLTRVSFAEGLKGDAAEDTIIAHKFGFRDLGEGKEKQFHDCGIVYYPGHPYLLCLMTRGSSKESLEKTVRQASRLVYQEVSSRYPDPQ